jgi:predicted nuclease with RNAse H fold
MRNIERKFFIGIDLGWKEKKTTGVCILGAKKYCKYCKDIFGKNILKTINPYLENTRVIAIDAPLTRGRGKGRFRLYEKFLSTKIFRQEKVNPTPPALMPKLCDFAEELVKKLEKRGFVRDLNLIETFSTLVKKICRDEMLLRNYPCQSENQKSALVCAQVALLHSQFKTRYLGYKDGFLFLPALSFWKSEWRKKFYQAWKGRPGLKYHHLITNVFVK